MTMDEALAAQKSNPKKIIVDVYTSWCGPCKLLDKNTFGNAEVSAFINQNYYPVKFNAEGKEEVNFNGNRFENHIDMTQTEREEMLGISSLPI